MTIQQFISQYPNYTKSLYCRYYPFSKDELIRYKKHIRWDELSLNTHVANNSKICKAFNCLLNQDLLEIARMPSNNNSENEFFVLKDFHIPTKINPLDIFILWGNLAINSNSSDEDLNEDGIAASSNFKWSFEFIDTHNDIWRIEEKLQDNTGCINFNTKIWKDTFQNAYVILEEIFWD